MWESENQDESPLMTTDNFHGIDRLVSKLEANKELRKMLGLDKPVPRQSEFERMSDADLINELAKQANELGVQIDLSYKFGEGD